MGLEDRDPPSLFSEKHRGLGGSGLPVLPCFPLAWCGQILQVPLGLPRDPTLPGVALGQACRKQVGTLEFSIPEQSWALITMGGLLGLGLGTGYGWSLFKT